MGKTMTEGSSALKEKRVIVIEATEQQEAKKLRVAAYARVSSDSSDQLNSFMAQMNYYSDLISTHEGWAMADIYADEGITGTSAEKRLEFQRLLSDCHKGRIDKILVKSISRFARNTKECLETIRSLKAIGVGVYFEEQNIDTAAMSGELLTAVFASIAQKESESISGNMRWSYEHRMKSGTYLPSSMPYGYTIKDKKIVVDEDRAKIVRLIFSSYLAGTNMVEIAKILNDAGVSVKNGDPQQKWSKSSISYILSNEKYIGDSLWQKTYSTDTFPVRRYVNNGEREKYYAQNTHPAIIDFKTYDAVQKLKAARKEILDNSPKKTSPLSHSIYCGHCGALFRRKMCRGIQYWECSKHAQSKNNCIIHQIPETEFHNAFLRLYHKLKLHGRPILKQMITDLQTVRERRMLWSVDIIELNKRISDLTDQDHTLSEMNKLGLVDPDIYISQSNELARKIAAAKQEKERLIGLSQDTTIPQTRELMEIIEFSPDFLPTFDSESFTGLVEKITVESNESLRITLKNGLELREKIERTIR